MFMFFNNIAKGFDENAHMPRDTECGSDGDDGHIKKCTVARKMVCVCVCFLALVINSLIYLFILYDE